MLWPYLLPYPLALLGLLLLRYARARLGLDALRALRLLEELLQEAFPDLPRGFTWREALARLRPELEEGTWARLSEELRKYEALRYGREGGLRLQAAPLVEALLALRGRRLARGAKL